MNTPGPLEVLNVYQKRLVASLDTVYTLYPEILHSHWWRNKSTIYMLPFCCLYVANMLQCLLVLPVCCQHGTTMRSPSPIL